MSAKIDVFVEQLSKLIDLQIDWERDCLQVRAEWLETARLAVKQALKEAIEECLKVS